VITTKHLLAILLSAALTAQCAGVRAMQSGPAAGPQPDAAGSAAMLAAAARMPAGSRVKVTLEDGARLSAVLLGVEGQTVVVRERTRLPEPPIRLDAGRIAWIELDKGRMSAGKMIAIGAAVGAGATLAFLAMLAAAMAD